MKSITRIPGVLWRFLRGEDVILVPQPKEVWDAQYRKGTWDRLQKGEPNAVCIAEKLAERAQRGPFRVLDVGCGNGGLALLLPETITYVGLDFSEAALAQARMSVPRGTFILAEATEPPADLGVFDVIVFNEVLYYTDPRKTLPAYRSFVTPETRVIISVVRFIRAPFVWNRIRRTIDIMRTERVTDGKRAWDIAEGAFTTP